MKKNCHKTEAGIFCDKYEKARPAGLYRARIKQWYRNF